MPSALLFCILATLLAACSSGSKAPSPEPGGGLQIHVRPMTDAERVQAIRVTLQPTVPGAPVLFVLDQKVNGDWSQTVSNLPPGSYTAAAAAFAKTPADPSFDETEDLLFQSDPTDSFSITEGQTTPVFIFLRQQLSDPPFDAPYFASIVFGSTPRAGQMVEITAKGGGGDGTLALSGSGHGSFANSSGDGGSATGATIEWTPATAGQQQISLHFGDGKGNEATVTLKVQVTDAGGAGDVDFTVHFNHSPWAEAWATIDISDAETTVTLEIKLLDDVVDNTVPIDYVMDFTDCDAADLDYVGGEWIDGFGPRNSTYFFNLKATDSQERSCTVGIEIKDRDVAPARQTQTFTINTKFLPSTCAVELTDCFGVCVDLQSNDAHCGSCGSACEPWEACNGGVCESICAPGLAYCDSTCVDLQTSDDHCGGCSIACANDETCVGGICESICGPGELYCDGTCVDPLTDDVNCNGCDNVCTGSRVCSNGQCICPFGTTDCWGQCVNTTDNDLHCGACGNACGVDQHCAGTSCQCDAPGHEICGTVCVNKQTDPNYCGSCNTQCGAGEACENGVCVAGCPPGQTLCPGAGGCVDLQTDPDYCGNCTTSCLQYDLCVGGVCYPDPEWANWPVPSDDPPLSNYDYSTYPGIVYDQQTKLMWQRAVPAGAVTQAQAAQECKDLRLGGYDDWRLPTRIELISITKLLNNGSPYWDPAIQRTAFPSTPSSPFWTSSKYLYPPPAGDPPGPRVWLINFADGAAGRGQPGGTARYRCVRFGPAYRTRAQMPSSQYSEYDSQVPYIVDNYTGLRWRKFTLTGTLQQGRNSCSLESYGGYPSRVPFRKRLETLVDVREIDPAMRRGSGFGYHNDRYWSETRYDNALDYWLIEFWSGRTDAATSILTYQIRCVAGP